MEDNIKDKWKSVLENRLLIAIIGGLVGALVIFLLTYHCYYKGSLSYYERSLNLLQQQVAGVYEQIEASNAWEHYNGLREAIHQKWYYIHSDDYDEQLYGPASTHDWDFREISTHCDKIRDTLRAKNYTESWELVEKGHDLLKRLPGPVWVKKSK